MKLSEIVETSRRLSGTRSRLEKMALIGEVLGKTPLNEVPLVVSCLSGRLPRGRLGIGHATLQDMRRIEGARRPSLDLSEVDAIFGELEGVAGAGSSSARLQILRDLYRRATEDEQEFLTRLLLEDLRQGSLEGVMLEAIARVVALPPEAVRRAFMFSGDLGLVARTALGEGASGLDSFQLEVFRPIQPMLAQTAENISEALSILGTAALEHKLDGARIQVHKAENEVHVYSRQSNDVTQACPEIVERIRAVEARKLVLDGEAIALDPNGRPHPFQTTMRRFGRKLDVAAMRSALPLTSVYFDCLFLDDIDLTSRPAGERFQILLRTIGEEMTVPRLVTSVLEEAEGFVRKVLDAGHEGIMAKSLDAPYEAGSRGKSWLKIKTAETLDLVVLAAEWGSGRRRGWLSNLHLGARDPSTGDFIMLGKTFKGMTDETLAWQTQKLQEIATEKGEWVVRVRPVLVVEIAFNDIQKSPHYPGGLALRFARLKAYREDKRPDEADTIERVREIYRRRTGDSLEASEKQLQLWQG
jgi:DNA ligase 1